MSHRLTATVVLMLALLTPVPARSEVGTAVVFLILAPGARANGMGQAFAAVSDDATAPFFNPGGLALKHDADSGSKRSAELFFMHSPWMPVFELDDLFLDYFSATYSVPDWGVFGLSGNYLNVGDVMETDEDGNELGYFLVYDFSINLSYATKITSSMGVGLNLKYLRSQLHPDYGVGTNWAVDLGWLYRRTTPGLLSGLSVGASISNWGPGISYRSESSADPMPRLFRLGVAYKVLDRSNIGSVLLSTEFNKVMVNWTDDGFANELRESKRCVGIEYGYADAVFLRTGYYYDREATNVPQGPTFGGGLRYKQIMFDFAFIAPPQDLGSTYTKMYSLRWLF